MLGRRAAKEHLISIIVLLPKGPCSSTRLRRQRCSAPEPRVWKTPSGGFVVPLTRCRSPGGLISIRRDLTRSGGFRAGNDLAVRADSLDLGLLAADLVADRLDV